MIPTPEEAILIRKPCLSKYFLCKNPFEKKGKVEYNKFK